MWSLDLIQRPESINRDPEFSGQLSRSLVEGHDFSYWLSLLSPNLTDRARVIGEPDAPVVQPDEVANYYRRAPLDGRSADLALLRKNAEFTALQQETSLRLWQAMHPDPLALDNEPLRVEDEILENCELTARQRFKQTLLTDLPQQPTDLIDTVVESKQMLV